MECALAERSQSLMHIELTPKKGKDLKPAVLLRHAEDFFVVVALLFYVQGKQLRSCRDGQLT